MRTKLPVPVEPKTPSRSSSRRTAPTTGAEEVDELAGVVEKVLKVSEPVPQTTTRGSARTASTATRSTRTPAEPTGRVREVSEDGSKEVKERTVSKPAPATAARRVPAVAATRVRAIRNKEREPSKNQTAPSGQAVCVQESMEEGQLEEKGSTVPKAAPATAARRVPAVAASRVRATRPAEGEASTTQAVTSAPAVPAPRPRAAVRPLTERKLKPVASSSRLPVPSSVPSSSKIAPSTAPSRRPAAVTANRRPQVVAGAPVDSKPPLPEWADPASDMSSQERAKVALAALQTAHGTLVEASRGGYKPSADRVLPEGVTLSQVREAFTTYSRALTVLRDQDGRGVLRMQSSEVERAALALVQKYITLDEMEHARTELQRIKPRLLAICKVGIDRPESSTPEQLSSVPKVCEEVEQDGLRTLLCQVTVYGRMCTAATDFGSTTKPFDAPLPATGSETLYANPFRIAAPLPFTSILSILIPLYRDLPRIQPSPAHWLRVHTLAIRAFVLACTASPPEGVAKTYAPTLLWKHTLITAQGRVKAGGDALVEAEKLIEGVVLFSEWAVVQKKEDAGQWYTGEKWVALLDLWISLGKKVGLIEQLGKSSIVDKGLSRMMSSTAIASPTASPTPTPAAYTEPDDPFEPVIETTNARSRTKKESAEITKELLKFNGEIASLVVLLKDHESSPTDLTGPAVISGLRNINMPAFSDSLSSLSDSKDDLKLLDKVVRTLEHARRVCRRQMHVPLAEDTTPQPYWTAIKEWLVATMDVTEDFLSSTVIASQSMSDVKSEVEMLALGNIDVAVHLCRAGPDTAESGTTALAFLERGTRTLSLVRSTFDFGLQLDTARLLSSNAHGRAVAMYRANAFTEALPLGQLSYDVAWSALKRAEEIRPGEEGVENHGKVGEELKLVEAIPVRVAEVMACCKNRLQDWPGTLQWYGRVLASKPRSALSAILTKLQASHGRDALESMSDFGANIARIAWTVRRCITASESPESIHVLFEAQPLEARHQPAVLALLDSLAREMMLLATGSKVVSRAGWAMYKRLAQGFEGYPVLRVKAILQQVAVMLEYDITDEPVGEVIERARDHLSTMAAEIPSAIRTELSAELDIYSALASYRTLADAKLLIAEHTAKAVKQLQSLLIPTTQSPSKMQVDGGSAHISPVRNTVAPTRKPPTTLARAKQPLGRATTTPAATTGRAARRIVSDNLDKTPKTPVKSASRALAARHVSAASPRAAHLATPAPVWLDVRFLIDSLVTLVSLLHVSGMTMQRIEVLKVARAILRGSEQVSDKVLYVKLSGYLAAEYGGLGKSGRARVVLEHAVKLADGILGEEGLRARLGIGLRWSAFLARSGRVDEAKAEYEYLVKRAKELDPKPASLFATRTELHCETLERAMLARYAVAAIKQAEGDVPAAMQLQHVIYRLASRRADASIRIAVDTAKPTEVDLGQVQVKGSDDDPFSVPKAAGAACTANGNGHEANGGLKGADEPSADEKEKQRPCALLQWFEGKYSGRFHLTVVSELLTACIELANGYALRGSAAHAEAQLSVAHQLAEYLKAPLMVASVESRMAELNIRMRRFGVSEEKLAAARAGFAGLDGPETIQADVLFGDLLIKQEAKGAIEAFLKSGEEIELLEDGFVRTDKTLITPRKVTASASATAISPRSSRLPRQHLLPSVLAHVLRQRILLSADSKAGDRADSGEADIETLMKRVHSLGNGAHTAEDLLLQGHLALIEVLKAFKADLFTCSIAESTISMPMTSLSAKAAPRSTTRKTAHALLARAEAAFSDALSMSMVSGRSEDVRQAGLSLAMLHAFQSSLGHGSVEATRLAADVLASTSAVSLHRELHELVNEKFVDGPADGLDWPTLSDSRPSLDPSEAIESEIPYRRYWSSLNMPLASPAPIDLSPLPPTWAVVSISVSDDFSSMFVTRHQRDVAPIIFCLPFDRQGKRELGDDVDGLPFELARAEMKEIIEVSDSTALNARNISTAAGRREWWGTRHELDARLKALLEGMEENWFGAFKSILASQNDVTENKVAKLNAKLSKVFNAALQVAGVDMRKSAKVQLDDAILRCFATLSSDTDAAQIEDLVYFILDIYGFHGVPVAISELDIDQIGLDIQGVLAELGPTPNGSAQSSTASGYPEHLFLILDRHTAIFPWESMPSLRGRSISRAPSLPFLMDQLRLAQISCNMQRGSSSLSPSPLMDLNASISQSSRSGPSSRTDVSSTTSNSSGSEQAKLGVNARKAFYILNPGGDLSGTQTHFESWMTGMHAAGWKGVAGRALTELEMVDALKNHDLVVYFGHGGAEQYIRSHKLKALHKCAVTMLWGCSSGALKENGDFDVAGTAWNYMMAGCLVANLWDVTDKDIDRLSANVLKSLHLEATHLASPLGITSQTSPSAPSSPSKGSTSTSISTSSPSKRSAWSKVFGRDQTGKQAPPVCSTGLLPLAPVSVTEAVNAAREDCKLKYLTGAAPVVYGLPVWMF